MALKTTSVMTSITILGWAEELRNNMHILLSIFRICYCMWSHNKIYVQTHRKFWLFKYGISFILKTGICSVCVHLCTFEGPVSADEHVLKHVCEDQWTTYSVSLTLSPIWDKITSLSTSACQAIWSACLYNYISTFHLATDELITNACYYIQLFCKWVLGI